MNKPDTELVKQVYNAQKLKPSRSDWCLQIEQDLKTTDIDMSEEQIASTKKHTFKALVTRKTRELATKHLVQIRETHSKSKALKVENGMKEYLKTDKLNTEEKILLFQLRTYTFDCKANYPYKFGDNLSCQLCNQEDEQRHLLKCLPTTSGINLSDIKYENLFGTAEEQINIAKVFKKVTEKRKLLLSNSS